MFEVIRPSRPRHIPQGLGSGSKPDPIEPTAETSALSRSVSSPPQLYHACSKTHPQFDAPTDISHHLKQDPHGKTTKALGTGTPSTFPRPYLRKSSRTSHISICLQTPDPYGQLLLCSMWHEDDIRVSGVLHPLNEGEQE